MKFEFEITTIEKNGRTWIRVYDTSYCPKTEPSLYLFPDAARLQAWINVQAERKGKAALFRAEQQQKQAVAA